jgi:leucyl aminopeptidase
MAAKTRAAAKAAPRKSGKDSFGSREIFGLSLQGWTSASLGPEKSDDSTNTKNLKDAKSSAKDVNGRIVFVGGQVSRDISAGGLGLGTASIPAWQWERASKRRGELALMVGDEGPLWLVQAAVPKKAGSHGGLLDTSPYGQARDLVGQAAIMALEYGLASLSVECIQASLEEQRGVLVGLELASYRFKLVRQKATSNAKPRPALAISGVDASLGREASALGVGTNVARHLVNLPAGDLNPTTYAAALTAVFSSSPTMRVEVWQGRKLEQERCGLLAAVGRAAPEPAALVRLSYRPKGKARFAKPLALVGKGITFDTGGIDLKDADSMRLMKKDMGGSAALAGLACYLEASGSDVPCDIYLALAENAVSGDAFRPGDILTARGGQTVEIHNTDAEGRLVLADAIDVALSQKGADAPWALIDLATLTGAMRIALGTRIGGLFANDDELATQLLAAGQQAGDPCWRMPLYKDYSAQLKTVFADVANASQGRFGGAITAALFLQRFVADARWAHIDLYAWGEGLGALAEPGGSGQGVQVLAQFLRTEARGP